MANTTPDNLEIGLDRMQAEERMKANLAQLRKLDRLEDESIPLLREVNELLGIFPAMQDLLDKDSFDFSHALSISVGAAAELAKNDFDPYLPVKLNGITELSLDAATELGKINDILYLDGLKHLLPETAKALAEHFYGLSLDGIKTLDCDTAAALANCRGALFLDGVETINPDAISFFKHFRTISLHLKNLKRIDLELASALAESECEEICLNGLKSIDRSAASAIWPFHRRFSLNEKISKQIESYIDKEGKIKKPKAQETGMPKLPESALKQIRPWVPLFNKNPNFKKLVLDSSAELATYLRQKEIRHPEVFLNLNAKANIDPLLADSLAFFKGLSPKELDKLKEEFERKTLTKFSDQPEFIETHKDEMVQVLADHLHALKTRLEEGQVKKTKRLAEDRNSFLEGKINNPSLPEKVKNRFRKQLKELLCQETRMETIDVEDHLHKTKELMGRLSGLSYLKPGEWGYKLASRNTHELTLGDECSDCTSANISGMNFWTVPVWLTDPGFNFVLQYDEEGNLAHKFGVVWEETGKGEVILTIDSMELGNSQKKKAGMNEEPKNKKMEEKMVNAAIAFIREWAKNMGLKPENLYAATASNTGTDELESFPLEKITLAKVGRIDASTKILRSANPNASTNSKIYLQSLSNSAQGQNPEMAETNIERGDAQKDFSQVEKIIQNFIQDDLADKADCEVAKSILAIAKEKPKEAARKMNIFLAMQAKTDTKAKLSVEGKRIDLYLNSRGHSLEKYLSSILGQITLSKGKFQTSTLYHLVMGEIVSGN